MEHTDRRLLRFLSLIGIICLFLLTRSYTTTFHSSERVPPITGTQLPYAIKTIEAAGFEDIMVLDDRGIKVSTTEYSDGFRACQFFCVWGLEVGGDSVGVGGGELGEGLFPVGGGASLDEACGGCSFVGGFAGVCEALGGSFVFDVADGEP